jgi:hypothetical protein
MKIRNKRHVCIRSGVIPQNAQISWVSNIDIPFVPDEVTVKTVALDSNNDGITYEFRSNLLQNSTGPLCVLNDSIITSQPNATHLLYGVPVRGLYSFSLWTTNGNIATALDVAGCTVMIHLEFVEYHKD